MPFLLKSDIIPYVCKICAKLAGFDEIKGINGTNKERPIDGRMQFTPVETGNGLDVRQFAVHLPG